MAIFDSLFQILGAACFCMKGANGPIGYLAVTSAEVFFGAIESAVGSKESFFSGMESILVDIENAIHELHDLKMIEIEKPLMDIQVAVKDYTDALNLHWNSEPPPIHADESWEPSLAFYHDPTDPNNDLITILEKHYDTLLHASNAAAAMWSQRKLFDSQGTYSLFSYYLLAVTACISCHRQLASAHAMVANKLADTNRNQLLAAPLSSMGLKPQTPGAHGLASNTMALRRPDPRVLLITGEKAEGSGSEFLSWINKHWGAVNTHISLVSDRVIWPAADDSRILSNGRLDGKNIGYYNQFWFLCVDLWRRAETSFSMPAEIYRWFTRDDFWDDRTSKGFGHGWLTSHYLKDGPSVDDYGDLLPPVGNNSDEAGSQKWLDSWYAEMQSHHPTIKLANLDSNTTMLSRDDQRQFLQIFRGIFGIGAYDARCTLYLLQRIRKQLMAWRLNQECSSEVSKLHAAAWPTTGELSNIVARLDETIPCSWERGADYLPQVVGSLEARWNDMAGNNGAGTELNPSGLAWMQGARAWWLDRRNADQAPMPLLPETIALILEVWLATALRAEQLQKTPREGNEEYTALDCYKHMDSLNVVCLDATTLVKENDNIPSGATSLACSFPLGLAGPTNNDEDNDKANYDLHREEIRKAWKRIRRARLDSLLESKYGLKPSEPQASPSEQIIQGWSDGLIDMSDNLPLNTPEEAITSISSEPGLLAPAGAAVETWWKNGNKVQYSYQLRSLSSFKRSGSDQLSMESPISKPITLGSEEVLNECSQNAGIVVKIPRDRLYLASQFVLWRTITDPTKSDPKTKTLKQWIGSGSFSPGQTEESEFHDGQLPPPDRLNDAAISHAPTEIQPPADSAWLDGNFAQYQVQFFDAKGVQVPSAPSPFSTPYRIVSKQGIQISIQADKAGLATQAQLNRRIVQIDAGADADDPPKVVGKLKPIAKGSFPVAAAESGRILTMIDGRAPKPVAPVVFSLRMGLKGLDLVRSDQPGHSPIWSSYNAKSTSNPDVRMAILQGDGNLVLYDENRKAHWASNTMEEAGKTTSRHCLRLRANGELAIVASIASDQVVSNGLLHAGDSALPCDRPAVFLRAGEVMLLSQTLSIDNQSPAVSMEPSACVER